MEIILSGLKNIVKTVEVEEVKHHLAVRVKSKHRFTRCQFKGTTTKDNKTVASFTLATTASGQDDSRMCKIEIIAGTTVEAAQMSGTAFYEKGKGHHNFVFINVEGNRRLVAALTNN